MPSSIVRYLAMPCVALGLFMSRNAMAQNAGTRNTSAADQAVAHRALQIVAKVHGVWTQMPGNIETDRMSSGALIGNGSVGVALGGTADKQIYYVGRNDFWSIQRGKIMPLGRIALSVPALQGATAHLEENIGPADLTGSFVAGASRLKTHAWVDADRNLFYIELENDGSDALEVRAAMRDGFGQDDLQTLGGVTGPVFWRRVSPEVVHATIGAANDGRPAASGASVRSLEVFDSAAAAVTPRYAWHSTTSLNQSGAVGAANVFSCGNLIMPEQQFSVRGSVRLEQAGGDGVIFSAVTQHWQQQQQDPTDPLGNARGHDTGRPQGGQAGLQISLEHGRLTANLNGTVVTADQPLTQARWTDIMVSYNGTTLTLAVDGKPAGETRSFPTRAQVMGPEWEWAASHPGDRQLPFAGIAPAGVLATRVLGATAVEHDGALHLQVPAGGRVILAVAATDNRDDPDYFNSALRELAQSSTASVAARWTRHVASWRDFWSRSYVEIPDKTVEAWWYGSLYVLASSSKSGNVAPGLWGNWITSTNPGWQGDYTLDYNYQAPFWAAFPTNHVDLADPYDAPLLAWMDRGRALAKTLKAEGLVYYTHLAPSPGWSADNFRALDQKSDALFAAVNCIQRWRYTRDLEYARKIWPFLTGVADFWDHDLTLVNGLYTDLNDAEDEHLWGPAEDVNPAAVIGFLNMLYPALLDMSAQLQLGQDQRATWQRISAHLSPLPLARAASVKAITDAVGTPVPESSMVITESERGMQWVDIRKGERFSAHPPVVITGSSAGMNSLQVVFPGWNVGLESPPALRQAALNTVDYTRLWYDSNNTSNFYPAAADAGYDPHAILEHLNLMVTHLGYQNFAYTFDAGGVENEATVPTTIAAMMLESYQSNIHVFPNWPSDQDASFGNLLAVGDFLVSSRIVHGRVGEVRIVSQRGGLLNLANPWGPAQAVTMRSTARADGTLRGAVLNVPTRAGEDIVFSPATR